MTTQTRERSIYDLKIHLINGRIHTFKGVCFARSPWAPNNSIVTIYLHDNKEKSFTFVMAHVLYYEANRVEKKDTYKVLTNKNRFNKV